MNRFKQNFYIHGYVVPTSEGKYNGIVEQRNSWFALV